MTTFICTQRLIFGLMAWLLLGPVHAQTIPLTIPPTAPALRYVGRFDTRDPAGPRCQWPASAVLMRFRGPALSVHLADTGDDFWQVVLDGKPTSVLETKGDAVYPVASGLTPGPHTVALVKRTEAFVGTTQVLGFSLPSGGALLPLPTRTRRRLEIVGDSITCGYGDEGKDEHEHFAPQTENASLAYGQIAARALGAECVTLAWSGRKMWPDNTVPEIYDRTLPLDPSSHWDFTQFVPQAVVINLSTNDWGGGAPDKAKWTRAYEAFISHLRSVYPNALIYCATSPMMGGDAKNASRDYLKTIIDDERAKGETRVRLLDFETQNGARDGLGSDYHPSLKTHQVMGDALSQALRRDLGWSSPVPSKTHAGLFSLRSRATEVAATRSRNRPAPVKNRIARVRVRA